MRQPPRKWQDEMSLTIYDQAKAGATDADITRMLGVTPPTFRKWKKDKPAVAEALKRARSKSGKDMKTAADFLLYVYGKMCPEAQEIFDELRKFETEKNGIKMVEALFDQQGKKVRQHIYLHALVAKNFHAAKACTFVGISRSTVTKWAATDPDFALMLNEINSAKGDLFESAFIQLIQSGDSSAIIWANKTFNADRGYSEKVNVDIGGQVDHLHANFSIDDLGLSLDVRKDILAAIRQKDGGVVEGKVLEKPKE